MDIETPDIVADEAVDPTLERQVERVLYREARLLDEGAYEAWLDLYTDDAVYWVPRERGQDDPVNTVSIIYEDKEVLAMRVGRLMHPRAHALAPAPRTTHMVGNIEVAGRDPQGSLRVHSALVVVEHREGARRVFSGRCEHRLRREGDRLRIASKRVDLADCDSPLGPISVPF